MISLFFFTKKYAEAGFILVADENAFTSDSATLLRKTILVSCVAIFITGFLSHFVLDAYFLVSEVCYQLISRPTGFSVFSVSPVVKMVSGTFITTELPCSSSTSR